MTIRKNHVVGKDPPFSSGSEDPGTEKGRGVSIPEEVSSHRRTSRREPRRRSLGDERLIHVTEEGAVNPQILRRNRNWLRVFPSDEFVAGESASIGGRLHSNTFQVVRHPAIRRAHEEVDDDDSEEGEKAGHIEADEGDEDGGEPDAPQGDDLGDDKGAGAAVPGAKGEGSDGGKVAPTGESHQEQSKGKGLPASSTNPDTVGGDGGNSLKSLCDGLLCQAGSALSSHIILSSVVMVVLALLCYWRLKVCCSRRHVTHGEYRMVTAQYVDSAFDDNLSEDGSDDENADGDWSKGGRRSIEMHSIDRETNGGLTLEEMNG